MALQGTLIRHMDRTELDELIDAQNEIFADYIVPMKSSKEFWTDFLRSVGGDSANVLVAVDKGSIIGYVNPVIDGDEAWVGGIGVVPEFRRRGLGRRLMLAAEEFSRKMGATEISLEVIQGNEKAEDLYRSMGYQESNVYLCADGKPQQSSGFGLAPEKATLQDLTGIHERAYEDSCWQRRKIHGLMMTARNSECYKVKGGFVMVRRVENSGFIPYLGVIPERRGQGIGTALMRFALNRLFEMGVFTTGLYNVNDELPVQRLLDKFDFHVTLKQTEMCKRL